jgi:cell cycle sensor histidine kinase DivJ
MPALTGFVCAPKLAQTNTVGLVIAVWLGAAGGLVAMSAGAFSPLVVLFAAGPALAAGLGRPWLWPSLGGAVACYLAALATAPWFASAELGLFGPAMALAATGLVALFAGLRRGPFGAVAVAASRAIAEVSHELRTPLTHILGFSEMIERQIYGPIGERYVEYAGLIRASGAHLLEMVNDLLDLSRIDAGRYELKIERFDIRDVIAEIVRQFSVAAAQKPIALGMRTPAAPLLVNADVRAVKRILINTVGNAIKFTPEGGRVIVSADEDEGALVLDTTDNGPGIPEAERARLGGAYERGAGGAAAEGTGLGLSLVRALAALHGGALSFHEAPGGGALVRVTLPIIAKA